MIGRCVHQPEHCTPLRRAGRVVAVAERAEPGRAAGSGSVAVSIGQEHDGTAESVRTLRAGLGGLADLHRRPFNRYRPAGKRRMGTTAKTFLPQTLARRPGAWYCRRTGALGMQQPLVMGVHGARRPSAIGRGGGLFQSDSLDARALAHTVAQRDRGGRPLYDGHLWGCVDGRWKKAGASGGTGGDFCIAVLDELLGHRGCGVGGEQAIHGARTEPNGALDCRARGLAGRGDRLLGRLATVGLCACRSDQRRRALAVGTETRNHTDTLHQPARRLGALLAAGDAGGGMAAMSGVRPPKRRPEASENVANWPPSAV
jgi:hypothetical protein